MPLPRLAPGVRLAYDKQRDAWILQAPERVIQLDSVGAAVLALVDGKTAPDAISATLAEEYDAPLEDITLDVEELIADLVGRGLMVLR